MKDIEFFGSVDRKEGKADGAITSEYPAWMHTYQIEELEESISRKERALDEGSIPGEHVSNSREELKREKGKLTLIKKSKPKLNATQKDKLYNDYKELGKGIEGYLFTRSDMMKGTADAHEEAERMIKPSIPVSPEIAEMCNLKPEKGKISRNDASKAWKIIGRALGEPTNVETLRKD